MMPFAIGDSVSFVADVEPEEVIILERHHRLDDVVQTLQACGQWDLDPSPNGGVDIFEFDADAGDAIDKVHDADYSELLVLLKLPHALALGVDRLAAALRIIAPIRDQAPTQRVERYLAGLVIAADDQQVLAGRGVP